MSPRIGSAGTSSVVCGKVSLLERIQGDPGLTLVVPAALGIVLDGLGVQGLEHHLAEPLPDGQLHGVVGGIVCSERQCSFESRIDLAESTDDALPYPSGPEPKLGADVAGHADPFDRRDIEHRPRRDGNDAFPFYLGVAANRDLGDAEVVAVGCEAPLAVVADPDVPCHHALYDVPVR